MTSSKWIRTGWILAAALAMAAGPAFGEAVDEAVTRAVARERVAASFPEDEWICWGRADIEDSAENGATAARAYFFATAGSAWTDEAAVRGAVLSGADGTDGESDLYSETATVLTGADDADSLVYRHFRGLPDWWQDIVRGGGTAMMLNPGDVRRVSSAAPRGGVSPKAKLRALRAERDAAAAARELSMPEAWREAEAEAGAEAAEARRNAWAAAKARLENAAPEGDK